MDRGTKLARVVQRDLRARVADLLDRQKLPVTVREPLNNRPLDGVPVAPRIDHPSLGERPAFEPRSPRLPGRGGGRRPRPQPEPAPTAAAAFGDVEVAMTGDMLQQLFRRVNRESFTWVGSAGELNVVGKSTRVAVNEGVLLVAWRVRTVETDDQEMVVPIMVGTEERNLGLTLASQQRVLGQSTLAALWSESLIAHTWSNLLEIVEAVMQAAAVKQGGHKPDSVESKPGSVFTRRVEGDTKRHELLVRNRGLITFEEALKAAGI